MKLTLRRQTKRNLEPTSSVKVSRWAHGYLKLLARSDHRGLSDTVDVLVEAEVKRRARYNGE